MYSFRLPSLLPKHRQHPIGHQKSARDVDGGDEDGDGAEDRGYAQVGAYKLEHAADEDDAADGVGDAHERGVEGRFDAPDDLKTNKTRENKHRQMAKRISAGGLDLGRHQETDAK